MKRPIDGRSQAARNQLAHKPPLPNDASSDSVTLAEMLVEMREATMRARSYAEGWVDQRNKMTNAVADFESSQVGARGTVEDDVRKSARLGSQKAVTKAD